MRSNFLRRTMAFAMTLCMALSMVSVASAAETATEGKVNLDLQTAREGSTLTARVAVTENTANFKDLQVKVKFDKTQLEYKSNTASDAGLALTTAAAPNEKGYLNVIATKDEGYTGTGVLYTASFTVKEGAPENVTVDFDQAWTQTDTNAQVTFTKSEATQPSGKGAVTGTVTSHKDDSAVTVALYAEGSEEAAYTTTVTGQSAQYAIKDVAAGTYTMKVSKANHVTRTYHITVTADGAVQNAEINLLGDVNADGKVDTRDWTRLYKHCNDTERLEGYALECANTNGDEKVDTRDWTRIYKHCNDTDPLWK